MKKLILGLFLPFALASLVHGAAALSSVPFATSQAQFASGDSITIQEVLATSPDFGVGDTVVVRGTYTLRSQPSAFIQIQLTSSVSGPPYSPPFKNITAGSGTFELEYVIQQVGSLHVTFYPSAGGSSFGGIYFASPSTSTTTPPPTT